MDKNQTIRYSTAELELAKKSFGGEGQLLYAVRDLFYQFDLTENQKKLLKLMNENEKRFVKKFLLPDLDPDVPVTVQADLYTNLLKTREMNPGIAYLHILANDLFIQYFSQQYIELETGERKELSLRDLRRPIGIDQQETRFVNMLAYNSIVGYIQGKMNELYSLANQKEETEEERKKRLKMDSSK